MIPLIIGLSGFIISGKSLGDLFSYEKLFTSLNLTPQDDMLIVEQNVTLPSNTHKVRIEYTDLSSVSPDLDDGHLVVYYLNTTPADGRSIITYTNNTLGANMIYANSTNQILSGNLTFNSTNINNLIITDYNLNGNIKIYTT